MAGIWHYDKLQKQRDGTVTKERVAVNFTDEQAAADVDILRRFEGLELSVSKGSPVKGTAAVKEIERLLDGVPEPRALHWVAELERIGAVEPAKKAEPPKAAGADAQSGTK